MFSKLTLPLRKELFSSLVYDYLLQNETVSEFYSYSQDTKGFSQAIKNISNLTYNRTLLVSELKSAAAKVNNTTSESIKNTELLLQKNCFTVTTGHQLCLFTGPLYFIYKIVSVINLCEQLKKEFPKSNFVPVYWMATEDHDVQEINRVNVFGKQIVWETLETGAVGDFSTKGLEVTKELLELFLGSSPGSQSLVELFDAAYIKHNNLSDASRYLVNALFGEYGLVVIDGNSKKLKEAFIPIFERDIFENTPHKSVNGSIKKLKEKNYDIQVTPREINCFFLEHGLRGRIEKSGNCYKVTGVNKLFGKEELLTIIRTEPEKISPNVVLRPCFQQLILPNIAYVGGPGELSYWLEYKEMFDELQLFFPVLIPRRNVTVIDKGTKQKMQRLGLDEKDIYENEEAIIKKILNKSAETKDLSTYKNGIADLFLKLKDEVQDIDKTLGISVEAEKQKSLNAVNSIEQKLNRAIRQKSDSELKQIGAIKAKLFPDNKPQERIDNFSMYYSQWGKDFLDFLKSSLTYDSKNNEQIVIEES